MENKNFDIKEFKQNIILKMPFIMDRFIANFSRFSSFDKFGDFVSILSLVNEIGNNPISQLDTLDEMELYTTEERINEFIFLANSLNFKINEFYVYLKNKTNFYDEQEYLSLQMDEEVIQKWKSAEKIDDAKDFPVGEAWK